MWIWKSATPAPTITDPSTWGKAGPWTWAYINIDVAEAWKRNGLIRCYALGEREPAPDWVPYLIDPDYQPDRKP